MATTNHRKARPGRTLLGLVILIVIIFGAVFAGTIWSSASFAPKLALDLEGGTQIILQPVSTNGEKVTDVAIDQAISIIRQRVDAQGVSETEITRQGSQNIVVSIPGTPSAKTLDLVRQSAQMRFRPVIVEAAPNATSTDQAAGQADDDPALTPGDDAVTGDPSKEGKAPSGDDTKDQGTKDQGSKVDGDDTGKLAVKPAAFVKSEDPAGAEPITPISGDLTGSEDPAATGSEDPAAPAQDAADGNSAMSLITPEVTAAFDALDCTVPANREGGGGDDATKVLVSCEKEGSAKYILGPVEIEGTEIKSASSGMETSAGGQVTGKWVVNMDFTAAGGKQFAQTTGRIAKLDPPRNQFAMVLDGLVISAPSVTESIAGGRAQVSGNFNRESANTLANQLSFGSLPLTFDVKSEAQLSATLGSEQLEKGIIAGLIGLLLVVIYSLVQYRVLGLVTVASLVVAALLTYGVIALLSWTQGYRLSLPGVAGLIVAIGITADSFIVYFERIRDELRDGRTLQAAVDTGWSRAKRTILASDAVNFSAAVALYVVAVGGVKGFAFTLGLTTIIDVVVVFFFTHPLMLLLAKKPFFADGHKLSGLDPRRLGVSMAHYAGRGRVSKPKISSDVETSASTPSATDSANVDARLTIAERRAAAKLAAVGGADTQDGIAPSSIGDVAVADVDETDAKTDGDK